MAGGLDCGFGGVDEPGSDCFGFRERIPIGHLASNHIVHRTGPAIEEEERKTHEGAWMRPPTPFLRTPVPPSVGVYHELSLKHTIVEIQCEDRLGLLYNISKAIFEHGFDITFARIATERGVAMDTFYIEPIAKENPDGGNLLPLREKLNAIVCKKSRETNPESGLRKVAQ